MQPDPKVPKYYLAKQALVQRIRSSPAGSALPPERDLAADLGIARTTLRQALAELVAEGLLERTQGRGTFVAAPPLIHVRQLTSLSEDASQDGGLPGARVLGVTRCRLVAADARLLGVVAGASALRVERLRTVQGQPLAHETALLVGSFPGLARRLGDDVSLYRLLAEEYDVRLGSADDTVETRLATPEDAALLDVGVGAPLLVVRRLARDRGGLPVELTVSAFRGDRVRFEARSEHPERKFHENR